MTKRGFTPCVTILTVMLTIGSNAAAQSRIAINGYASFEIEKQIEPRGEGAGDPNFSFDADLFDLVLNIQLTDRIRVATDLSWEHGSATEDNRGNVAVEYAFTEYAFSDLFKIRVGKFLTPFGIFNEIHTAKPAFLSVKEASSTNKTERIVKAGYRFFPRWSVGIGLQGDGVVGRRNLDYVLVIANGEQETTNPFEKDVDLSKSVTARVRLGLTNYLNLGGSFYFDNVAEPGFRRLISTGVQAEVRWRKAEILFEMVRGAKTRGSGTSLRQLGWFVQPAYRLGKGVTPYMRFEHLDPDLRSGNNSGIDIVTGVNFEVSPGFIVKVDNNYFRGAPGSSLGVFPGRDYNEIKAAVVLGF